MKEDILSKKWRLNNLYRIVNKEGHSIPFKLNYVQQTICDCDHKRRLILKARQLGMSTYAILDLLDDAIHNKNLSCGIVSYSLEHAQHIFKRIIGHALETLRPKMKDAAPIISHSAREITFANGSFLRVDTSLRGGSYANVLVSEFGKTCARSPIKAEEVVTGTLQAIPIGGKCTIESTGEGNEGFFAEMCYMANERGNENLSELDFHFFFYPWYMEPSYVIQKEINYDVKLADYFSQIQKDTNFILSAPQKNWYAHQCSILGDKIKQEFPSTVSEAFLSSSDAYYFASCVQEAYQSNRVVSTSIYDALASVYVVMDIGINDLTVIIFYQLIHGEIRIIDYYEDNGKGVDFYSHFLMHDKKYIINTIFLPHDATKRDGIVVENTYEREFRKYFTNNQTKFLVLKPNDKNLSISNAKLRMSRCVFDAKKTKPLLDHLMKYRKKWSEQYGRYIDEPYHDLHSHFADAFNYAMQSVNHLETVGNLNNSLKKHKDAVELRSKSIY